MPLLDIRNLTIEFMTPDGPIKAVDRVSIMLNEGEVRGLVGESGSGKILIAKALSAASPRITGALPPIACVLTISICYS